MVDQFVLGRHQGQQHDRLHLCPSHAGRHQLMKFILGLAGGWHGGLVAIILLLLDDLLFPLLSLGTAQPHLDLYLVNRFNLIHGSKI